MIAVSIGERRPDTTGAPPVERRPKRRWTSFALPVYTAVVMVYLVLPILVMILYSFNDSSFKKVSFRWLGFTAKLI